MACGSHMFAEGGGLEGRTSLEGAPLGGGVIEAVSNRHRGLWKLISG